MQGTTVNRGSLMSARTRMIGGLTAVLVGAGMLAVPGGATAAPGGSGGPRFTAGAAGAGDAYFPYAGNGGYDVQHYDLDITYTPPAPAPAPLVGQLAGVATIDLVATQDLDRFNLDLRGMGVQAITINGKNASEVTPPAPGAEVEGAAYWQVQDDAARVWELTIQPRPKIKKGQGAQIVVAYGGETTRPEDIEGALYGWVTQRDGAMVVGEPEGSMTWYPVSDHQTDKATYSFEITVPEGKVAVANGLPAQDPITANGWTTWYWDAPDPQASYLTTASVGDYELRFVRDGRRAADHRRRRRQSDAGQRHDYGCQPRPTGGHDRLPRGHLRAVPVQLVRLDRGRRHRRLCARDADPARVLQGRPRVHRRCMSSPTSGSGTR